METCQSPRTVFLKAYAMGCEVWKSYSHACSRCDFQLPQLYACLVLRQVLKLSYRRTEAFLGSVPEWLAEISMSRPPDHNTLWRAAGVLLGRAKVNRMLDLQAEIARRAGELKLIAKPLTIDSTCFDPHHRSRHYDQRCRKMNLRQGEKYSKKQAANADRRRSQAAKRQPKMALAVAASSHFILAVRVCIGQRSDHVDFPPLLRQANRRVRVKRVAADAGYDSHQNHVVAREQLKVQSIIPPRIGRPSDKPPASSHRRNMQRRFKRKADQKTYGQRAQSETVYSMIKRNLGDAMRSRRPKRRKSEMLLRAITHNTMLISTIQEG